MRSIKRLFTSIFICCYITSSAFAQQVPDNAKSGVVERNVDQKDLSVQDNDAAKSENFAESVRQKIISQELENIENELNPPADLGPVITIDQFEFSGNTIFANSYLELLLTYITKKPIHFKDLKQALNVIDEEYRIQGYFLARAILPAQDVTRGTVRIQIVEGVLGEVIVDGAKFYSPAFIKSQFAPSVCGIINYHALLKSIILLNEYPDLNVRVVLQKGSTPATTDIILNVEDKRPLHVYANYNNFGSRFVSKNRSGTGIEYSNLVIAGDRVSVSEANGFPLRTLGYVNAGYSLPVNTYGTRVGVSYEWSEFDVQKQFRRLDAGGRSQTVSMDVTHPLHRTLSSNIDLLAGFDAKDSRNYLLGRISSVDRLRLFKLGVSGDRLDDALSGRNYFSAVLVKGFADAFGASKKNNPLASRSGAGGSLFKSNIELSRYQKLPFDSVLMLKDAIQLSNDVLPVSEQLSIGGHDTVRGFAESEHLGDTGSVLNLELNMPLPFAKNYEVPLIKKNFKDFVHLVGFWDYGIVYLKNPQVGESKHHEIAGAGFGFRFDFGHDLKMLLDFGFPVAGDEPSSGDKEVTYLQATKKF